jgi:putative hydrolase of the HAD superfamily
MLALFDLDNTLIDRRRALSEWVCEFVCSRRLTEGAAATIRNRLSQRARPADFEHLREVLGLHDDPSDLWRDYVNDVARLVRCFPEVREGLAELRAKGWILGVATNGPGDIQRAKIATAGLAPLFDGICVSEEVAARKPAFEHFEAAASLCGARLRDGGWMIGDNPQTDIEGGRAAGLRTAWVAADGSWADGLRPPDVVVRGAAEAINVLRSVPL